ncbi:hypothetical protein F441_20018 [Phytophthora nicotianae CJ01A1]|uniref:Uncharacterized protein n=1 Tax=Phytophthora nicotianae CJ01A1 TaxID=1317063 RepID=W2VXD9_PHYNI|nr:hypothetical protein F441_20018 [Phytophthora nicotianae CJ01A1]
MLTHPASYVNLLELYNDPAGVSVGSLAPIRKAAGRQRVAGPRQAAVRQQVAGPHKAGEHRMTEPQGKNQAAEDAATPADLAAERLDDLGQNSVLNRFRRVETVHPSVRLLQILPSNQPKRSSRARIRSGNQRAVPAQNPEEIVFF